MHFRVHEILLVSSAYDAFILEEDGRLTPRLFREYADLSLSQAPRITRARTASHAMELLMSRRFDLVITMVQLQDMDVTSFARRVKSVSPGLPVVVLSFSEAELLEQTSLTTCPAIDRVFMWTGDAGILIAIIKLVEDVKNVDQDTRTAGVRAIIVVEDSVRRYSAFLSVLYAELVRQAASLVAEGVNDLHKILRLRARPRILLATTYEEAVSYYRRYRSHVLALISDKQFPRNGTMNPDAGFALARLVRQDQPNLPILMQSADPSFAQRADEMGLAHVEKNSPALMSHLRRFLREQLGFGPFVFRLPDGTEIARARNTYEMEDCLQRVDGASLAYHSSGDHFSLWLMARSMFRLAAEIKPMSIERSGSVEALREDLIRVLRQARVHDQEGAITDFASRLGQASNVFLRIGEGSIGGKGRGVAFASHTVVRHGLNERFADLEIRIPHTIVIGTGEFDRFMEENQLGPALSTLKDDAETTRRFLQGRLPDDLVDDIRSACQELVGPLAVRSSSLLEDSQHHPFAGIYATYILPNCHADPEVRLAEVCRAIKAVYASIFSRNARSYIAGTPHTIEEEKMGIVIQQLVGQRYGERFYPHFSGVALSYNYYPSGGQVADQGVAALAVGLGQMVMSGGSALQFCPSRPTILPQYPTARQFTENSQSTFYALDLTRPLVDFAKRFEDSLIPLSLEAAEHDGTLAPVGSVYSADNDSIRDTLAIPGPRVVTFNNVLKWQAIPLAAALSELLSILRAGLGRAVEMEFAVDMGDWGRPNGSDASRKPCLYVLQIRPQSTQIRGAEAKLGHIRDQDLLCHSTTALGHGLISNIHDVVYVKPEALGPVNTAEVARQISDFNVGLQLEQRPYLLVGPGRWGSSDPNLGIPVSWCDIAGTRVIVELPFANRTVEPSQGSHFFHNLVSLRVGYITIPKTPRAEDERTTFFDRAWLDGLPAREETSAVRHVRLERPLLISLDGRLGQALILKEQPANEEGAAPRG
jgi:CheY-like chemotaxis protein